jgi:MOSC domain-containing protein YiiM
MFGVWSVTRPPWFDDVEATRRRHALLEPVTVVAIHIGPVGGDELQSVEAVLARAGKGLEGDRHFHPEGAAPGQALTLVEEEVVTDVALPAGGTRRQVTVRGVRLNDLVGRHFRVGEVLCYGVEICEPCLHLQQLTRPGIIKDLVHRGGINADILEDGTIRIGDALMVEP